MSDAPTRERFTASHVALLALLALATFYDGFDASMFTLAAPDVMRTLGISVEAWGPLYTITRIGVLASFFFLMSADRFGRRPLLLVSAAGFALASLATSLVGSTAAFIACQTAARLFLTALYGLAIIIAGEELPASLRARGVTVLTAAANLGTVAISKAQSWFLLVPGPAGEAPAGNWAHDGALALVAWLAVRLGLPFDGAHWRGLYAVGGFALLLVPALALGVRETERFRQQRAGRSAESLAGVFAAQLRDVAELFAPRYRKRFSIVAGLWNCVYLVISPSVAFWAIYARQQVGMTPTQIGDVLFWAYLCGALGHLVAGQLVDRIGRKATCAGFFALGAVAIVMLFQTRTTFGQYAWQIATVFLLNAALGATHVYASEVFPTALRATGYGWTTNLFGRVTELLTPTFIGALLAVGFTISNAIALVGIGPILGALLIARLAIETRGLTLEQIQERLDAESSAGAVKAPA